MSHNIIPVNIIDSIGIDSYEFEKDQFTEKGD